MRLARLAASLFSLSLMLATFASTALGGETIQKGDRIVFLGDSITQAGAAPGGYVTIIRETLAKEKPDLAAEVIGAGISGNKAPDLLRRLDRDVIARKPTLVVVYIGINDVWHWQNNSGTNKEDFEEGLGELLKRIKAAGARVVLCTPSVIGEKTAGDNRFDQMLDEYAAIGRTVAKDAGAALIDLRAAFVAHLKEHNEENKAAGILTTDGVHLNAAGNQFVAAAMLAALGVGSEPDKTAAAKEKGMLRHVVLFKFKDTSSKEDVAKIVEAFGRLPEQIKEIHAYEWGTNVSPEGRAEGFTHCFFVTFQTEKDRDAYLPHPAHKAFIEIAGPHIDKVLVVDYWTHD